MHVHVAHPEGEAKFWIMPAVMLASSHGLSQPQIAAAQQLIQDHLEGSRMPGLNTLAPEITHISKFGIWLLFDDEELYLPFESFPWFRGATIDQITHLEASTKEHLYWPDLDIDLSLSSIREPHKYPLVDRA